MGLQQDYDKIRRRAHRIGECIHRAAARSPRVNVHLRFYLNGEVGYLETLEVIVADLNRQYEQLLEGAVRAADFCGKCRERLLQANLKN